MIAGAESIAGLTAKLDRETEMNEKHAKSVN